MVKHSVSLSSWIDACADLVSIGHEFGVIDPTADTGLGSRTAVGTSKRIHLVSVGARTEVAITHNGGPLGIGGGGWAGGTACVNGRTVSVGIV